MVNKPRPSSSSTEPPNSTSAPPPSDQLPDSSTHKQRLLHQLGPLGGAGSKPDPKLAASLIELDQASNGNEQNSGQQDGSDPNQDDSNKDLNVVAAYKAHFREDPLTFLSQLWAYRQGRSWRGYQNYIGSRILYPGHSEEQIKSVLQSEQVKIRIQALATRRVETLLASHPLPKDPTEAKKLSNYALRKRAELELQLTDVARAMIEKSAARLDSLNFLKIFAVTVNNLLARMYHLGIHLNVHQVLEVRRVAAYAAERKQSIIFLPCHKSHIDYLTVSWLLFRLGIALPHIVAGENLDLPVVGSILRGGGAFFIRRTFANDQLYPVVIREYIEQLLASGKNIECFIEGTRSRTGKLLPPKLGILKYVLDGLLEGRTEDVWLCPISVQYDSVIESETYVSELLGKPKESESLLGLLSGSSSLLGLKMGRIDIRFETPWSLKGFIKEQVDRREAPGPNGQKVELDVKGSKEHQSLLLKALGYRVLADINKASVIMPAALVGTVILTLRGRGVGKSELIRRVEELKKNIIKKGYQVADFGNMSTTEVVDRALAMMKDLITVESDVMEMTYQPNKRFELSFYRNQVIHVFVSECLISTTLYTKVKQGGIAPMQIMSREEILKECSWISSLLRNEFVYSTEPLSVNVEKTVRSMEENQILSVQEDGSVGISDMERAGGREKFDSYLFLLWPAIEAYWLSACSLLLLAPPSGEAKEFQDGVPWFAAKDFEARAQLFGKTLYAQGELSYLEAINAATLGQSFTRWEDLGMIKRRKSKSVKPIPLMSLSPDWWPNTIAKGESSSKVPSGKLWDFLEHLGTFRREGKDRRDQSDIVGVRIMRIVEKNFPPVVEMERKEDEAKL